MGICTFEITSGRVNITDPCYGKAEDESDGVIFGMPAKKGKWQARVEKNNDSRCISLEAHAEVSLEASAEGCYSNFETITYRTLFVDSGQMGIFDAEFFEPPPSSGGLGYDFDNPKTHYEKCGNLTLSDKGYGSLPHGVVSSSGYGDGAYQATLYLSKEGELVGVIIEFVWEEEDEDDDEENDEDWYYDNIGDE